MIAQAFLPITIPPTEQEIGTFQNNRPWETCATVGQQWAYNPDDILRPIEECLRGLVCCAIGDGNLLLNVGPRPDGMIEDSHAARLREMGEFLQKYGESIYATRGGPFIAPDEKKRPANEEHFALVEGKWWGGSTHKGDAIYLHILRWPAETVALPALPRRVVRHSVLTMVLRLRFIWGPGDQTILPLLQKMAASGPWNESCHPSHQGRARCAGGGCRDRCCQRGPSARPRAQRRQRRCDPRQPCGLRPARAL